MNDTPPRPPRFEGPPGPGKSNEKKLGNTWINPKGEVLMYYEGRELTITNWEHLNMLL